MLQEKNRQSASGIMMLIFMLLLALPGIITAFVLSVQAKFIIGIIGCVVLFMAWLFICIGGFFMVEPNQAVALTLFDDYAGTVTTAGLKFDNPFYAKKKLSLRVRNFESEKMKVNDLSGSPIEIAAIVVWRVTNTAEALFAVDQYESFVRTQSEAAIREMATSYPYDDNDQEGQTSLRKDAEVVCNHLKRQIQERLKQAGVEVLETRISHLAYAPEIASAMLQRQQAGAIVAARQQIVEGAVGMVDMALAKLAEDKIVELDEERKAAMISNLLVVLCGDKATQPVVNSGSLY